LEIAVGGYGHFGDNSAHELEDFLKKASITSVWEGTFGGNLGRI
jgi:hypothetical protein